MKKSTIIGIALIAFGLLLGSQLPSSTYFGTCIDNQCWPIDCIKTSSEGCTLAVTPYNYDKATSVIAQEYLLIGLGLGIIMKNIFSKYEVVKKK